MPSHVIHIHRVIAHYNALHTLKNCTSLASNEHIRQQLLELGAVERAGQRRLVHDAELEVEREDTIR